MNSIRILLAEDDTNLGILLKNYLTAKNYETFLYINGILALDAFRNKSFDLCILDIMMPEMDGFQTLKNIRSNTDLGGIPIYAVTAKAMVGDKEIILKHGFNDYIPKPVNSTIISSKIAQLFSKIKSN